MHRPQSDKDRQVIEGDKRDLFKKAVRGGLFGKGHKIPSEKGAVNGIGFLGHDGGNERGKILFSGFGPGLVKDFGIGNQLFYLLFKSGFFPAAVFIIRGDGAELFGSRDIFYS